MSAGICRTTIEGRVWDCLVAEGCVENGEVYPHRLSSRDLFLIFGESLAQRSVEKALFRLRSAGLLISSRDGHEFLYAIREGAERPTDKRGLHRRKNGGL